MLSHASLTPPSASPTGTPCIHSQNTDVDYNLRKLHNGPANCSFKVVNVLGVRGNAITPCGSSGDQRREQPSFNWDGLRKPLATFVRWDASVHMKPCLWDGMPILSKKVGMNSREENT
ncbi:hypothetical protein TcCL_Unassigned01623 [Trypanosoma cruzi]|nr:hypothetical protein TcCL_Unassigned01623 [Trypanosoma cruzi]